MVVWSAISVSGYGGLLMPLMARAMQCSGDIHPDLARDSNKQNYLCFFAMIFLGFGEVFGGLALGYLRDNHGNKTTVVAEIVLLLITFILAIIFNAENKWHPGTGFMMCLAWGLQDAGVNNLIWCVCGFEFES